MADHDDTNDRGFVVHDRRSQAEETDADDAPPSAPAPDTDAPREHMADVTPPNEAPGEFGASPEDLPPLTFATFVLSLGTQALVAMGLVPNPLTNDTERDLPAARQTIDILEILEEKTRGNLDPDEQQVMQNMLYDLRLRFVEATKGS